MRWVAVLVVSAAGVALGAAGLLLLRDDGPKELLPDLDPAAPTNLEIVQDGDVYRLIFAGAVDNVGPGPLLVEGERPSRETAAMSARQLVRRTDGSARTRPVQGRLAYADLGRRSEWRLAGFEVYELRSAPGGQVIQSAAPAGSCLGDRYRTEGAPPPGRPDRPVWTDECGRDQPGLLVLREGISQGFGADFGPGLDGQSVDVTNVPAGRYVLVHRVNPQRSLEEGDYANNAASLLIQLRRAGSIPSVRVLARCPRADTCAPGG